jgi:1,4-alpha-glucan branching enzyme
MKSKTARKKNSTNIGRKRVIFYCKAQPGSEVYIAGDFNNWDPARKKMQEKDNDGIFTATMMLPPGEYEYKFVINGEWSIDPECDEWIPNSLGSINSLVRI